MVRLGGAASRCAPGISGGRLAIASSQQLLDDRNARLEAFAARMLSDRRHRLVELDGKLALMHPATVIAKERAALARATDRMGAVARAMVARRASDIGGLAGRLDAMSPLKVLGRGYAIATRADGRAIREVGDVKKGERVTVRVEKALFEADVVDDPREPK